MGVEQMKKIVIVALAAVLVASVASAQTQVLSRNAVGYTKVTADRDAFALVRNDFVPLSGDNTPSNLFGLTTFPTNTTIYVWDGPNTKYNLETIVYQKAAGSLVWSPGSNVLDPGMGFWVKVPSDAPSNEYTAFMMGEVPDRFVLVPEGPVSARGPVVDVGLGLEEMIFLPQ